MKESTGIHRKCPLCTRDNRQELRSLYSRDQWDLKRCVECNLLYLENALPHEEFVRNHAWTKSYAEETERRRRSSAIGAIRWHLKRARGKFLPHNKFRSLVQRFVGTGSVLDIGCGSGRNFRHMEDGIIPFGIDIDEIAAKQANRLAESRGGRVYEADALSGLQALPDGRFDGITMHSYLEHEIQPLGVLREAARVIRPNGKMIIKVPNFACWNRCIQGRCWPGFRFPDHVNYFTPETIQRLLAAAGLAIRRFALYDRLPTSDSMWLLATQTSSDVSSLERGRLNARNAA